VDVQALGMTDDPLSGTSDEMERMEAGYPEVDEPTGRTLAGESGFRDQLYRELERLADDGYDVEPYLSDQRRVDELLREHDLAEEHDNIDIVVELIIENVEQ
jgi:hypothetical protein